MNASGLNSKINSVVLMSNSGVVEGTLLVTLSVVTGLVARLGKIDLDGVGTIGVEVGTTDVEVGDDGISVDLDGDCDTAKVE